MNKSNILVIILAIILSLITLFIFDKYNRNQHHIPTEINKQIIEEQVINEEKDEIIDDKDNMSSLTPISKTEVQKDISQIRKNIKQTSKPKVKTNKVKTSVEKNQVINKDIAEKGNTIDTNTLNNKIEEEGIVIPVSYTSNNTYKYVYTPSKFNK